MKDGFVILFFDVYGLNLYSGLMVSLLGQLLHENGHKCGKMKLQFYDQKKKLKQILFFIYIKNWFVKASQ
jgi:hypothetical protein